MKPVLLLLTSPMGINKTAYIRDCVKETLNRDEIPLSSDIYSWLGVWRAKFINTDILKLVEKVVVYDDFGISVDVDAQVLFAKNAGKEVEIRRLDKLTDIYDVLDNILFEISEKLGIPASVIADSTREREVVEARHVYCRRARESTDASLAQIGRKINRDHASVLYGIRQAKEITEVIKKYNRCYANQTEIAYSIMASAGGTGIRSVVKTSKGPVVSYGSVEKRGEGVFEKEPALQEVRSTG